MTEGEMDFMDIGFEKSEVYRYMGAPASEIPGELRRWVDEMVSGVAAVCRPRFCYRVLPLDEAASDHIIVNGQILKTGRIISRFFSKAELCLVYVATSGREYETWARAFPASGDIAGEFIADSIGSEIAEAASRKMIADVSEKLAREGLRTGNSYSPGYCGWRVDEQNKLFSMLPPFPAEVKLNESSLMSPVKSVSGIVPAGWNVEKMPYGCDICGRKECYKRRIR